MVINFYSGKEIVAKWMLFEGIAISRQVDVVSWFGIVTTNPHIRSFTIWMLFFCVGSKSCTWHNVGGGHLYFIWHRCVVVFFFFFLSLGSFLKIKYTRGWIHPLFGFNTMASFKMTQLRRHNYLHSTDCILNMQSL